MTTPLILEALAEIRDLAVEVCHDLMNRALRNESDEIPDHRYSKIYRDQEAAVRALLAALDWLQAENDRLAKERDEALTVLERGSKTDRKLRAVRSDLKTEVGRLAARVADVERQRDARAAQVEEMLEQRRSLQATVDMLEARCARMVEVDVANRDRAQTIADEAFGPFPVQSLDESLMAIERGAFEQRRDLINEITLLRSELARYTAHRETGFQGRGE